MPHKLLQWFCIKGSNLSSQLPNKIYKATWILRECDWFSPFFSYWQASFLLFLLPLTLKTVEKINVSWPRPWKNNCRLWSLFQKVKYSCICVPACQSISGLYSNSQSTSGLFYACALVFISVGRQTEWLFNRGGYVLNCMWSHQCSC